MTCPAFGICQILPYREERFLWGHRRYHSTYTRGEDTHLAIEEMLTQRGISLKDASITTDGAPSIIGKETGAQLEWERTTQTSPHIAVLSIGHLCVLLFQRSMQKLWILWWNLTFSEHRHYTHITSVVNSWLELMRVHMTHCCTAVLDSWAKTGC